SKHEIPTGSNPKYETRNPKQIRSTKSHAQNDQGEAVSDIGTSDLGFVLDFEFRHSDFGFGFGICFGFLISTFGFWLRGSHRSLITVSLWVTNTGPSKYVLLE